MSHIYNSEDTSYYHLNNIIVMFS